MALFRKNIWTLFLILSVSILALFLLATWLKWQSVNEEYRQQQHNLVQLVSTASNSLLMNQELMLDVLGQELVRDHTYPQQSQTRAILNDLINLNPDIIGFGLATPDGYFVYTSSNLDIADLPNLMEQDVTRESFLHALESDYMVLGRTYFMKPFNSWIIPIRKAIRDSDGDVIAVMTAGLRIQGASRFFSDQLHLGDFNMVTLIREFDHRIQYRSSIYNDFERMFSVSVEPVYQAAMEQISLNYNIPVDEIRQHDQLFDFVIRNRGKVTQAVAWYDSHFELWIVSEIDQEYIVAEFLKAISAYFALFILGLLLFYRLFASIARAEEKRQADLVYQATHDTLTGLPNRGYLQQLSASWADEETRPFSILYINMDNFKHVNDSFGHAFGDLVLQELTSRLIASVPEDITLIRQGGDEFIALGPVVDESVLLSVSRQIIATLSEPYDVNGIRFTLGASIGIALYPQHGDSPDLLLRSADIAMYEAKKHKNSARVFASHMQDSYLNKVLVEQKLRHGLEQKELFMVYQPQVDCAGQLYGVEALVRWNNAELGFVPPDQFIPVAEASGLMPALGNFILHTTLNELAVLQKKLSLNFDISINISVSQFLQPDFIARLTREIQDSAVPSQSVTLEITESLFIEDLDQIIPLLKQIHDMGLQISMDDFGTGYSSLSMLRQLPIDELKIDKSFVDGISDNQADQKMIQNIIAIGKNYDLVVLAEGVEDQKQMEMLQRFGCDRFQGYHFSRPLSAGDLERFVRKAAGCAEETQETDTV